MPRVRFLESVYQDGASYDKGREYEVSAATARGLGNSVVIIEEDKPEPAPKQAEPKKAPERKDVEAAPVDKMVKAAPKKK